MIYPCSGRAACCLSRSSSSGGADPQRLDRHYGDARAMVRRMLDAVPLELSNRAEMKIFKERPR